MTRVRVLFSAVALLLTVAAFGATYVVPPDDVLIRKSDSVVIARALHSRVEESKTRGIETITVFAVEDRLKSDRSIETTFEIRIAGGTLEAQGEATRFKIVPGAPRFIDGEQLLLFVKRGGDGAHYHLTDLALGRFSFGDDDAGNRVLVRAETEIHGWNVDGSIHREPRRQADRFLRYVRDIADRRPAQQNYIIEARPLIAEKRPATATGKLRQTANACVGCTVLQYTLPSDSEVSGGFRWKTFPVPWNRGNSSSNLANGGNDSVLATFMAWQSNSSVNYQLSSATANANGIFEAPDGVNNIVFEKVMAGINPFSCASGGVLGVAGVQSGFSDGTNVVNGEVFFRTSEADVSMNQGVNACVGTTLSVGNYNSGLAHEVGHTLGFRHADRSRDNALPCTNFAAYDCETSALMTATVTNGLAGMLGPWDQRAVTALYPGGAAPLGAPTSLVAGATSATSVALSWIAPAGATGATTYEVQRSLANNFNTFAPIASCSGTAISCTDTTAAASSAYLYRVRAGTNGAFSAVDLATTVIFTDPTLTAGVSTVRVLHVTDLRNAVNAVQRLALQANTAYTDPSLSSAITAKAAHLTELRSRLTSARTAIGVGALSTPTDPTITATTTTIKRLHIIELRAGVQ